MMFITLLHRVDCFPSGLARSFNTVQSTHFSARMHKYFFLGSECKYTFNY